MQARYLPGARRRRARLEGHETRPPVLAAVAVAMLSIATVQTAPRPAGSVPTFAKDVAPIMFNKCAICHRPGEVAPMSLLSYEDVAAVGEGDQDQGRGARDAALGRGPGAHAARCATIAACRRQQIDTIVAWVDGGAPKGNDADMPPVPKFADRLDRRPRARLHPRDAGRVRRFPPKASSACRCSTRRCRGPKIASRRSSRLRPSNRAVVHHAGVFFVDIPGRRDDRRRPAGRCRTARRSTDRGAGTAGRADVTALPGANKLLSWVPGRGVDSASRGHRQAHSRRQVHQLADALQPDRQAARRIARASASGSTRCR